MWVGFLWKPEYSSSKPVPLDIRKTQINDIHANIRDFHTGKDPAVLEHIDAWDPAIGIVTLRHRPTQWGEAKGCDTVTANDIIPKRPRLQSPLLSGGFCCGAS
jgi:hypothetical protein